MHRFLACFVLLMIATTAHAQSALIPSSWKNQRGSEMQILWPTPSGFGGFYTNLAKKYPKCYGKPYFMSGSVDGQKISFSVVWNSPFENCQARTDWSGKIQGNRISTRWVITLDNGQIWRRGADFFTRQ